MSICYKGMCRAETDNMLQGTIEGHERSYKLAEGHTFESNTPVLVCGNIVAMLGEGGISHLGKHFQVSLLKLVISSVVRKLLRGKLEHQMRRDSALLSFVSSTCADSHLQTLDIMYQS
jgi:hypothetical protein